MARYGVFRGIKITHEMDAEIRRRARADERTVSAYLRRLIASALTERGDGEQA